MNTVHDEYLAGVKFSESIFSKRFADFIFVKAIVL